VVKPDSERDRQCATVEALSNNGWIAVVFDTSGERKSLREGDVRLLPLKDESGAEAADSDGVNAGGSGVNAGGSGVNGGGSDRPARLTVRLLAGEVVVPAGGAGGMTVGLDCLRPGWSWKGGRWAGPWIPKVNI